MFWGRWGRTNWEHWDPPRMGANRECWGPPGGRGHWEHWEPHGGKERGTGSTGVLLGVPKPWGTGQGIFPKLGALGWHWDDPGVAAPKTGSTGVLLGTWVFPKLGALELLLQWEHWCAPHVGVTHTGSTGVLRGGIPQAGGTETFPGVSPKLGALEPTRSWAPPNWEHWDPPSPGLGASPLTPGGDHPQTGCPKLGALGLPPKLGPPRVGTAGIPDWEHWDTSPHLQQNLKLPKLGTLGLPTLGAGTLPAPNWWHWDSPRPGTPAVRPSPPQTGARRLPQTGNIPNLRPQSVLGSLPRLGLPLTGSTGSPQTPPNWDTPKLPPPV